MPIKFQCLGGEKELLNVTINTGIKSTVTLKGETKQTDDGANVTFSRIPLGVHRATITAGGFTFDKNINVVGRVERCGVAIKDLPLNAKIKFSSGKKFVLMAKNVKRHATNTATLVSEYIIENYPWTKAEGTMYSNTNIHKKLMPKYYNELNEAEKSALVEYEAITQDVSDTIEHEHGTFDYSKYSSEGFGVISYFWIPSPNEFGSHLGIGFNGYSIGFDEDTNPCIKHFENGAFGKIYSRYGDWDRTYGEHGAYIGDERGSFWGEKFPLNYGIVPACDISQDAFVTLGDDGYYRIIADRFLGKLAKDLPLKSKIKLSSGKTFILRAKNASGHEDNTVTLMSEYIIENAKWSNGIERVPYSSSDVRTKTLQGYYNVLTTNEKLSFVPYGEHGNIWLMAESDASSLNLSVQGDRIMKFSNGKTGDWMTRDYRDTVGEQAQDGEPQDGVIKYKRDSFQSATVVWTGGKFAQGVNIYEGVEVSYSNDPTWRTESGAYTEYGVVPFFDLNGNTKLEKDSDGYYRILGM